MREEEPTGGARCGRGGEQVATHRLGGGDGARLGNCQWQWHYSLLRRKMTVAAGPSGPKGLLGRGGSSSLLEIRFHDRKV
jgi:hypothetical protein